MKIKLSLTYFLLVFMFINCNNKDIAYETEEIVITTSNEVAKQNSTTTNFFKDRKLVRLETNENSLISRIRRLVLFEGNIYIFDQMTNSVLIFNENGKFLFKIQSIGKGPGEYIQLSDFVIDENKRQIVLLTDIPNALFYFDLDGKYIGQKEMKNYYGSLSVEDNTYFYVSYLNDKNTKHISVDHGNKIEEYISIEGWVRDKFFYSQHMDIVKSQSIYYFKVYDPVIYQLSKESIVPKYKIVFAEKQLEQSFYKNHSRAEISKKCFEEELISSITDFRESDKYLTFKLRPYGRTVVYNKNNKECSLIERFYDPEVGLFLHEYIGHDGKGGGMVFIVDPEIFINNVLNINDIDKRNNYEIYRKYEAIANQLDNNENPILMIYSLKD